MNPDARTLLFALIAIALAGLAAGLHAATTDGLIDTPFNAGSIRPGDQP